MWPPGGADALMGDGTGHDRGQGTHPGQLVGPQAQGILGQEHQIGLRTHRHRSGPIDAGRQGLLDREPLAR